MTTFKKLGLNSEIMNSLDDLGFVEPSPIQEESIPFLLKSKQDLIALAQTGTGKTAAFSLPILNQMKAKNKDLQAIIICPTRELCIQTAQGVKDFSKYLKDVDVTAVYGGERIDIQIRALRKGTNIVVGTPGRVHDLIRRNILKLQNIKWLVLDEADEMLDMGFKDDLDAILDETPEERQTLLFSATMSRSVHSIAKKYMKDAHEISVGEKNKGAENVSHEYYVVQPRTRFEALKRVIDHIPDVYGIIFCRTRHETQEISDKLKQAGYGTEALHGEIAQAMRTKIMDRFKKKQIRLLVATDVAARGIDVNDLTHVINYNLPDQNEAYTHRSGRTGRAGSNGVSVSIVTPRESRVIRRLEDIIGKKFEIKKIPDGKEVCKRQINTFVEEIKAVDIDADDYDEYFSEVVDKLKKLKKEDLIKHFIFHKFKDLVDDYKHSRNLNAEAESSGPRRNNPNSANLQVNIGRRHGLDVQGLFSLINSSRKLKGLDIGTIELMSDSVIFSVDKGVAETVIKELTGGKYQGEKIEVTKSDREASYSGGRRGGSGRSDRRRGGSGRRRFSGGSRSGGGSDRRNGGGLRSSGGSDRRRGGAGSSKRRSSESGGGEKRSRNKYKSNE